MRSLFTCLAVFFIFFSASAQSSNLDLEVYKHWKLDFAEGSTELELSRTKKGFAAPQPVMKSKIVKQKLDAQRTRNLVKSKSSYSTSKDSLLPKKQADFTGLPIGNAGIPNDNTMAISNDGIIISAINTTVTILDEKGERLGFKTLYGMTSKQLGLLDRYYDPKVTYDPVNDRFILVFLEGSLSNDTRIIVGFTETDDPLGIWNFYALNGKPFGGKTWSDYPIIAHNSTDLYITVNLLRDNESWQEGFVESLIWQVNKEDGYSGEDTLRRRVFSGIEYNGEPVWSICPVQPALDFNQENMYFLSVRPDAESNDTVFLHEVTGSSLSEDAEHKLTVLKSNMKYGVPPTAYQPLVEGSDFRLQTNDTRVLSATSHNNRIHYTQSTKLEDEIRSGIYHGIIDDVSMNPVINASIISSEKMDYAYPSIAFAGEDENDEHSMLITFSHVGEDVYPGTSVAFHNKKTSNESIYSDVLSVRDGDSVINSFVADTAERWGDYTDIQRKYNEPGIVWACGSFGDDRGRNNVWIAKLKVSNELTTVDEVLTYPNPANSSVVIAANFEKDQLVSIRLSDMKGSVIRQLEDEPVVAGPAEFLFNIEGLESGIYIMTMTTKEEVIYSQKIIVE